MTNQKSFNRREFLKRLGVAAASTAAMTVIPLDALGKAYPLSRRGASTPFPFGEGRGEASKMTYRRNRHSGDEVSILGFGMMRLPSRERRIDQDEVNRMVDYAIASGVNYFDTAPVYHGGRSEEATGIALRRYPREKWMVATKLSNFGRDDWTAERSKAMYERSFVKLGVDVIDYYLLHSVGQGGFDTFKARFVDNGMIDFLVEERRKGRIRNLGFSYHGDQRAYDWLMEHNDQYHWDFCQIQMNYLDWDYGHQLNGGNADASYLYSEAEKRGVQVVIMESLRGGQLAKLPKAFEEQLRAQRPDDSIASWAFRYLGTQPNVLTCLSGMSRMEHVQDNVKTCSPIDPLTTAEAKTLSDIAAALATYRTIPCTTCAYCMPCPYGVDIPGNFKYYNTAVNDGTLPPVDTKAKDYKKKHKAYVDGYRRTIPKQARASQCIGCEQCLSKCPQHIPIPENMAKLVELIS